MVKKSRPASSPSKGAGGGSRSKRRSAPARQPASAQSARTIFPEHMDEAFEPIAKLLAKDPPAWLAKYMRIAAVWIWRQEHYYQAQPTRCSAIKTLTAVQKAANTIIAAFSDPAILEFIYAEQDTDFHILQPPAFLVTLLSLRNRAAKAARKPSLAASEGKALRGRGRAAVDPALPARTYCALIIAETWKELNGRYPSTRNRKAAEAADILWSLLTGAQIKKISNPESPWRGHFETARSASAARERESYLRDFRSPDEILRMLD